MDWLPESETIEVSISSSEAFEAVKEIFASWVPPSSKSDSLGSFSDCSHRMLDVSMHGRSGLDALKEIRASTSKVPVLVLSGHPEEQYAVRVLKAGPAGYLVKGGAPQELCRTVRRTPSVAAHPRCDLAALHRSAAFFPREADQCRRRFGESFSPIPANRE